MQFDGFDWNAGNRSKCEKHGVSIAEIEGLFQGPLRVGPDPKHSTRDEQRFCAAGRTASERSLFVVFTWRASRDLRLIRPVSARYMHAKEAKAFEEAFPRL